jgi:hypothetical protein
MHELSEDSVTWVRASIYPDLFVGLDDPVPGGEADSRASGQPTPQAQSPGLNHVTPAAGRDAPGKLVLERKWYYNKNDEPHGPFDLTAIQELTGAFQIGADDLVWTDGMAAWAPVKDTPEVARFLPAYVGPGGASSGRPENHGTESQELPKSLCKSAFQSRPWVVFIATGSFVYAALSIIGGIFLLIEGASVHLAPVVATGLFSILYGGIAGYGGLLLMDYANRLTNLNFTSKPIALEKAMDALRKIWIYVSILIIVMLAFLIVFVIWIIAISGTIAGALHNLR